MSSPLGLGFNYLPNNNIWDRDSQSVGKYKVINNTNVESLFKNAQFSPFPSIKEGGVNPKTANPTSIRKAEELNGDEVNKISTTELIDWTQGLGMQSMQLTYADFAYLKNLGVYPNNRLMIARRFTSPVSNDLTQVTSSPMATLISWVPDNQDFISVSFGEVWDDADASFKEILNDVGKDMTKGFMGGNNIGSGGAAGFGILSLPGFMEGLQYEVLQRFKPPLTDAGIGNSPLGNPNIIRKAMKRATVEKERAGSGLACSVSVKFVVEYEQKFINGVDPTLVYLDILQNALTFGTSDASFQFSSNFAQGTEGFIEKLISGDAVKIVQAIGEFVTHLIDAIKAVGQKIINSIKDAAKAESATDFLAGFKAVGVAALSSTLGHVISKYKVKLLGVVNSLTGSPSTPWHLTIGNPKKPIFCSGDMLCTDVSVTMGRTLSFNDLPSSIKIEFTLKNARPLGAQEIFNRFNTGKARTYARFAKSYVELPDVQIPQNTTKPAAPNVQTNKTTNSTTSKNVNNTPTPNYQDEYFTTGKGKNWFVADKNSEASGPINVAQTNLDENGDFLENFSTGDILNSNQSSGTTPNLQAGSIA
jgi:hypothetical protein